MPSAVGCEDGSDVRDGHDGRDGGELVDRYWPQSEWTSMRASLSASSSVAASWHAGLGKAGGPPHLVWHPGLVLAFISVFW